MPRNKISLKEFKNIEKKELKGKSNKFKSGFYLGVLGGTDDIKIREYINKKTKKYAWRKVS